MKKFISIFLSALIFVSMISAFSIDAFADSTTSSTIDNPVVNHEDFSIRSSIKTSSTKKDVAEYIRDQMVDRATSISISFSASRMFSFQLKSYLKELVTYACSDELSISSVDGDYIAWSWQNLEITSENYNSGTYNITFAVTYYTTHAQENEITSAVKTYLSTVDFSNMTTYQLLKTFHDFIVKKVTYDMAVSYNIYNDVLDDFSAYGVFCGNSTVCQGYSLAFYRLCKEVGINCRIVTSNEHAWNIVELDGQYYYVDTTWDDEDDTTVCTYDYFLIDQTSLDNKDKNYYHLLESSYSTTYFYNNYQSKFAESDFDSSSKTISNCIVSVDYSNYANSVVKSSNGTQLPSTSYSLSQTDDKFIVVTGLNDYSGSTTRECSITSMSLSNLKTTYSSPQIYPTPVLGSLVYGTDYVAVSTCSSTTSAYGVVQGTGRYTGSIPFDYTITRITITDDQFSLSYTSTEYNGKSQCPKVISSLTLNKDYTVESYPITDVGNSKVVITGINGYKGTVTKYFSVTKSTTNNSNQSTTSSNKSSNSKKPKPTTLTSVKANGNKVKIKWKKIASISGYQLQIATSKNFKKKSIVEVGKFSKSKTSTKTIAIKGKYYVRIRTYKKSNGKKVYSTWSKVKSIKVK